MLPTINLETCIAHARAGGSPAEQAMADLAWDELQSVKHNHRATCAVCGKVDWWGKGWQSHGEQKITCSDKCRAKAAE